MSQLHLHPFVFSEIVKYTSWPSCIRLCPTGETEMPQALDQGGSWDRYWSTLTGKSTTVTADYCRSCEREILLAESHTGALVIEPGCGRAAGSLGFAAQEGRIFALDFSGEALRKARDLYRSLGRLRQLHLVQADIRHMPVRSDVFDVTWNQGVLEHYHDPRGIVSEMIRVTKPGGKVIVFVPNRNSLLSLYYRLHMLLPFLPWPFGRQAFMSHSDLSRLFDESQGTLERVTGVVPFSLELPFRDPQVKAMLRKTVMRVHDVLSDVMGDRAKALFGREVCVVFRKKRA